MGEERHADIFEAAVKAGAGAVTGGGKLIDGRSDKGRTKTLVLGSESRQTDIQTSAGGDFALDIEGLAKQRTQSLVLREQVADNGVVIAGKRRIQRLGNGSVELTLPPHGAADAGGTMGGNHMGESFERAARSIKGRKPRDQVEQQILAQIIEILLRQPEPVARAARDTVGCQ